MEYATEYGERQQNPNMLQVTPFYWANLKTWQTRCQYKRTQIPEAVRSLRELVESRYTHLAASKPFQPFPIRCEPDLERVL